MELWRLATIAPMNRAVRTATRPPAMKLGPRHWPDWRVNGANFVATNTIEGRALQRLLEKLEEIRDALEDDAVFNVVGDCCCPRPISNASPVTITPAVLGMRIWKSASRATSMSANSAPFFKLSAPNARKLVRDCTNLLSEFL
jgi:hypothetical protein